ncbi:MAG TPA: metallophosphoesterase family protein [Verrucomicrobiae bacterium]|nr:metallophosphoesterase family protein [Verrucomicrobiae bacterium]
MAIESFKVGVISDTHGHLDPRVKDIFAQAKVDHIIHAGDIGLPFLILDLEDIAPVTAVLGNTDEGIDYKETEMVELNGRRFLVHHIVDPQAPHDKIKRKIIRENPDVVVFGHTHKPFCETIGNTLYFNPGYAGKQRFSLERSVAVLHCDGAGITAEYTSL